MSGLSVWGGMLGGMGNSWQVSTAVFDRLAVSVAEVIPAVAQRVPVEPAIALGRLSAPEERPVVPGTSWRPNGPPPSGVGDALRPFDAGLVDQVLDALAPHVDGVAVDLPAAMTGHLRRPTRFGYAFSSGQHVLSVEAGRFDAGNPGAWDLVLELATALCRHDAVAAVLADGPTEADEAAVAAHHGSVHLGLATVVAASVTRAVLVPAARSVSAQVGVALGTAAVLLSATAPPPAYLAALLARHRAEYGYGVSTSGSAVVRGHRFVLADLPVPDEPLDFSANGLVVAVPGGAAIRTGVADGRVTVTLQTHAEPPAVELSGWDDVVEISWTATVGAARVDAAEQPWRTGPKLETPPWPGPYRLRVHSTGRDGDDEEYHALLVWPAPEAPPIVHKRTDRLGHRLRGEPEPAPTVPPDAAYRWIESSWLESGATITVVTGATVDEVIRAFGADPEMPASSSDDAWCMVSAQPIDGAVLAIEGNGWRGSDRPVLEALSANGLAASMYWNVDAMTALSFARDGRLLASFEPGIDQTSDLPELADALAGLDFDDDRHHTAKGVTAVTRFTGHDFGPECLDRALAGPLYDVPGY
jgi:hypothetical protein